VADVFAEPFDVALTWRDGQPLMPYNTGVMFGRGTRFWKAMRERQQREPRFEAFVTEQEGIAQEAESGGHRVKVLPCAEWNNSDVNDVCVPPARVLHYKGARKEYMVRHYLRGVWK